jgi:hypothetical protein
MADISPKVARTLARFLAVLVARLEAECRRDSDRRSSPDVAFENALLALTDEERHELMQLTASLAATLAVASAALPNQQ